MDTTRIKSGDATAQNRIEIDLPPEPLAALLVTIDGKTASSQDLSPSRVGRLRVQRFGEQIQGEDAEFYHDLANIKSGHPTNSGGTNEQSHLAIPVPFGLKGIPNVLDVQSNEEADLILDLSQGDLGTAFGSNSATYSVIGLVAKTVPERYVLRVQESNLQSNGSGRQPGEFNAKNVASVYMRDPDSVVDEIQLDLDGDVAQDTLSSQKLQDLTNLYNRIETSGLDLVQVHEPDQMNIQNTLNSRVSYDVKFSGAGTAEFTLMSTRFNNERSQQSAQRVQRVKEAQQARLANPGGNTPQGAVSR